MIYKIYTPSAPSHGHARKYVRNVNVWVVGLMENNPNFKIITSPTIKEKYMIEREVDSRYDGSKSRYGKALARAEEKMEQLSSNKFPMRDYLLQQ